jgi:hypothetical protein
MADDIATQARKLLQDFSTTMERMRQLQSVTVDCKHVEDLGDTWLLREHFLTIAEAQWDEFSNIMVTDILPFVADFKHGLQGVSRRSLEEVRNVG